MSEQKITAYLIQHNHLWSYDARQVENLPDSVLIEHALLYSDVEGLLLLFKSFDKDDIRRVWEQKIVPHRRYHKLNFYLGLFFFRIPNIRTFLEQRIVEYPTLGLEDLNYLLPKTKQVLLEIAEFDRKVVVWKLRLKFWI